MTPEAGAFDLKAYHTDQGEGFSNAVEGWRWYLPVMVTWYGIVAELPDFSTTIPEHVFDVAPNTKITSKVRFSLNADHPQPETARLSLVHKVGNNEYPVTLPVTEALFQPGETKEYDFTVTSQHTNTEIISRIEPVSTPTDANRDNNEDIAHIEVQAYDIAIKIQPLKTNWVIPDNSVLVESTVTVRRKDNFPGTLPVKVTINGPGGPKVHTLNLGPKEIKQYPYNFNAGPGTYTINGEAWPANDSWTDVYPQDNKDSVTITVKKMNLPETDRKIRVGL
ncbi:hypothetical protein [Desulfofalx alkaliphila]|uniref:hypothetical protein n=1 Tax=Desulfofalx alkaliphila TaxID=105483 RepID=UPI0004E0BA9C|nr:hypothetical protein [Desulfofalx alkaliphila]